LFDENDAAGVLRTRIVGELAVDGLSSRSQALPPEVITHATHTHPGVIDGDGTPPNPLYRPPEDFLLQPAPRD
jgi:hypothetical protein